MKKDTLPTELQPPTHLSDRAKAIWSNVVPRRARSPERLALLTVALESLDRAEAARQAIEVEGMTSVTPRTGMVHVHPLLKVEREARTVFLRAWGELKLQWCPITDGVISPGEWGTPDGDGDGDPLAEYAARRESVLTARSELADK